MPYECIITWSIEDIHSFRENSELPKWTDEQADRFLGSISRVIEDRSIELGWEIIGDTMPLKDGEYIKYPMDLP